MRFINHDDLNARIAADMAFARGDEVVIVETVVIEEEVDDYDDSWEYSDDDY